MSAEAERIAQSNIDIGLDGGSSSFVQDDGNVAIISSDVLLGYNSGSNGIYCLDNGGSLETGSLYVGFDGTGAFDHNVGDVNVRYELFVIYGPNSNGSYVCWAFTSNLMGAYAKTVQNGCTFIGYEGTGSFIQHNGTNKAIGTLDLGVKFFYLSVELQWIMQATRPCRARFVLALIGVVIAMPIVEIMAS